MALPLTLRAQLTPPATASTSKSGRFFRRAVLLIALLLPTAQAAEVIEDSAEIESLAPGLSSALQEDESKSSLGNAASDHHTSVYYTMQANRERLNPKNFHGKLGFNFQIAPSIKNAVDYTALDFSYGFPFSWGWLEIMFAKQTTTFARVGHHAQHPAMLNSGLKTKNDIIMLGSGITMVADYPQMLLTSFGQKLYATASTYLIFLSYKDRDWGQTYNGFGMKVDAGFHYRMMDLIHVGVKAFYYLAALHTTQNNNITIPSRITLSWPAIGVDVGYYF